MKLRRAGKSFPRQLTTGTESSVFCLVMYRELSGHYHGGQRGEQELRNQVRGQSLNLILSYFHFYCMTICYVPKCRWSLAMVKCTWVAVVEIKEKWVTVTCERQRRKRWIASKVKYQGICRLAQDSLEVEWGERKKKTWNEKKSDTLGLFPIFNIVFFFTFIFFFSVLIHALKCTWVESVDWPQAACLPLPPSFSFVFHLSSIFLVL